jgi:hypothetical protein
MSPDLLEILIRKNPATVAGCSYRGLTAPFLGFALNQTRSIKPLIVDKIPKIPRPQGAQKRACTPVRMATEVRTMAI